MITNIYTGICEYKHKHKLYLQTGCNGTGFNLLNVGSFMMIVSIFWYYRGNLCKWQHYGVGEGGLVLCCLCGPCGSILALYSLFIKWGILSVCLLILLSLNNTLITNTQKRRIENKLEWEVQMKPELFVLPIQHFAPLTLPPSNTNLKYIVLIRWFRHEINVKKNS